MELNGGEKDFNPRPPRGGRRSDWEICVMRSVFQSTPPARGATGQAMRIHSPHQFQSTPPARGATAASWAKLIDIKISIHAPREGGDRRMYAAIRAARQISIHAPREGGDARRSRQRTWASRFQSTPPARGATTPPAAENSPPSLFQSTPPARGATRPQSGRRCSFPISIHAPREGGDVALAGHRLEHGDFNPRPPRGGRPVKQCGYTPHTNFNPRPPRGGRPPLPGQN